MTIREELRLCAKDKKCNWFKLSALADNMIFYCFTGENEHIRDLSNKDRATFMLLVAEAL